MFDEKLKEEISIFCSSHPLKTHEKNIVIGRGEIPCEVLFIGEAPGKTENEKGIPFCGRSGDILNKWIKSKNLENISGITNSCFLMPTDENGKIRKPSQDEIKDFRPYVVKIIELCKPKYIVLVGSTACESIMQKSIGECLNKKLSIFGAEVYAIYHPAYYMRNGSDGMNDFSKLSFNISQKEYDNSPKINEQEAKDKATKKMISEKLGAVCCLFEKAGMDFKDVDTDERFWLNGEKFRFLVIDRNENGAKIQDKCSDTRWLLGYKEKGYYEIAGYITDKELGDKNFIPASEFLQITDLFKIEKNIQSIKEIKQQRYVPLHLHTEFSIGDALGKPDEVAEKLFEKGFKACAITDHGTLSGAWYLQKALLKKNIKPIMGMEAYVIDDDRDQKYWHITILVKNEIGWKNLLKINHIACKKHFYRKPRNLLSDIIEHKEGLIILTGCPSAKHSKLIQQKEYKKAQEYLNQLKEAFGENLVAEIFPHFQIDFVKEVNSFIINWAENNGVRIAITTDAHYPDKEDEKYHRALKAISMNLKIWDKKAGFTGNTYYYLDTEEILKMFKDNMNIDVSPYLEETIKISDECNFKIDKKKDVETIPVMGDNPDEELRVKTYDGLKKLTDVPSKEQIDRIELELNRIKEKGYANYLLMIKDIIDGGTAKGCAYGNGRGSIGGSFVGQLIGLHRCDTIKYDLIFDRFISVIRKDAPDVDMDFQDSKRHLVFDYIKDKYGEDKTCKIVAFSKFHAKGVIRDVGRIYELPYEEVSKVANLVVHRGGGDMRASYGVADTFSEFEKAKEFKTKYPEAVDIMEKLEGRIRHLSVHAAGTIICRHPIDETAPVLHVKGEICTAWEKKACEEYGLVKVDVLGLTTLDIIEEAKRLIKKNKSIDIEIPCVDLNDANVYRNIISNGNTDGVFQCETVGFAKLLSQMKCMTFENLVDGNALMRPGPMHVGAHTAYVLRLHGKEKIEFHNEVMEKITSKTMGLVLYQEQVMTVMHDVGGLSWATAEMIRKAISKSEGKKIFDDLKMQFQKTALEKNGISYEKSGQIFDEVQLFGSYGFNKAHAVAYSMLGYQTAWLKNYFPIEFLTACLAKENNPITESRIVADARHKGIAVLPPDVNKSEVEYSTDGKSIYCGLGNIKGIGNKASDKICSKKPFSSIYDFYNKTKISQSEFEHLVYSGALDCFGKKRKWLINSFEKIKSGISPEDTLLKYMYGGNESRCEEDSSEYDEKTLMLKQMELLNFPAEKHPIVLYPDPFNGKKEYQKIRDLNFDEPHNDIWVRGIITFINFKQEGLEGSWTMFDNVLERKYAHVNLNDDSGGNVLVHFSPEQYTAYKKYFERGVGTPVIIKGSSIANYQKIYADAMVVMDDIDKEHPIFKYVNDGRKHEMDNIKKMFPDKQKNSRGALCDMHTRVISAVRYKVSKNKKPYAMLMFYGDKHDERNMCFKIDSNIFVTGEIVVFLKEKGSPFIEIVKRIR